eukprot:m.32997 g.32997  ORF g.32997 m.32997 type:complete len:556 (-) comp14184_c0_seq3:184-1851(-)
MTFNTQGSTLVFDDDKYAAMESSAYESFGDQGDTFKHPDTSSAVSPVTAQYASLSNTPATAAGFMQQRTFLPTGSLEKQSSTIPMLPAPAPPRRTARVGYICVALMGVVAVAALALAVSNPRDTTDTSDATTAAQQNGANSGGLARRMEDVEQELQSLMHNFSSTVQLLTTQNTEQETRIYAQGIQINNLTGQLNSVTGYVAEQAVQINNLTSHYLAQQVQILAITAQLDSLSAYTNATQISNLTSQITALAIANSVQDTWIRNLSSYDAERGTQIYNVSARVDTLNTDIADQDTQISNLTMQILDHDRTIIDLARHVANLTAQQRTHEQLLRETTLLNPNATEQVDVGMFSIVALVDFVSRLPTIAISDGIADAFRFDQLQSSDVENITGNVQISQSDVTVISGLNMLTTMGGYFSIVESDALASVSGLNMLMTVEGYLRIANNDALTDIRGLNRLTSVGEYLYFFGNDALTDIRGLNMLTSVRGFLRIQSNGALANISGLHRLTSVGGYLHIYNNPQLTAAAIDQGLAALQCVGSISSDCTQCTPHLRSLPIC